MQDSTDSLNVLHKSPSRTFSSVCLVKNLLVDSVACLLAVGACDSLTLLPGTQKDGQGGLATICVSVQFAGSCLTAVLFPKYLLGKFGCRNVMAVSLALHMPYVAAGLYPHWALVAAASVAVGVGNPLFWVAQCRYLNDLSVLYAGNVHRASCEEGDTVKEADATGRDFARTGVITENGDHKGREEDLARTIEIVTPRFFGMHGLVYQVSHVWCNVVSYLILQGPSKPYSGATDCRCGVDSGKVENACSGQSLEPPSDNVRNVLVGSYVAVMAVAIVMVVFLLDELLKANKSVSMSFHSLAATLKLLCNPYLVCLVPLSLSVGVSQGFVLRDFTKDFIACAWGADHVGLVMISYGCALSLSCAVSGWLVQYVGRRLVFLLSAAVQVAAYVLFFTWKPSADEPAMFFVMSGLQGCATGAVWSQLRAFYGILFRNKEEEAFANYQLWHSIGVSATFAYSTLLCTDIKMYLLVAIFTAGIIGYFMAEWLYGRES